MMFGQLVLGNPLFFYLFLNPSKLNCKGGKGRLRRGQARKDGCLSKGNSDQTFGAGSRKMEGSELSAHAQSCI